MLGPKDLLHLHQHDWDPLSSGTFEPPQLPLSLGRERPGFPLDVSGPARLARKRCQGCVSQQSLCPATGRNAVATLPSSFIFENNTTLLSQLQRAPQRVAFEAPHACAQHTQHTDANADMQARRRPEAVCGQAALRHECCI